MEQPKQIDKDSSIRSGEIGMAINGSITESKDLVANLEGDM